MKHKQKDLNQKAAILITGIVVVIAGWMFVSMTKDDQNSNNHTHNHGDDHSMHDHDAHHHSDEDELQASETINRNSRVEHQAVTEKNPDKCREISGESIALGPRDEEIAISEDQARQRCQSAAETGAFASPRLEMLLETYANPE